MIRPAMQSADWYGTDPSTWQLIDTPSSCDDALALLHHAMIRPSGCWEWTGGRMAGYGYFGTRRQYVHRLVYARLHGMVPDGMHVCHRCDNPLCFRPQHLFLGTARDNVHDSIAKGRFHAHYQTGVRLNGELSKGASSGMCRRGHSFDIHGRRYRGIRLCRICERLRRDKYLGRLEKAS